MHEKFSDAFRKMMTFANQEAMSLNHEFIGSEHILLGLIKEAVSLGLLWRRLEVNAAEIRAALLRQVHAGPDMVQMGKLPQDPKAKKMVESAMEIARGLNSESVEIEHMLLALCTERDSAVSDVLQQFRITYERVMEAWRQNQAGEAQTQSVPPSQLLSQENSKMRQVQMIRQSGDHITVAAGEVPFIYCSWGKVIENPDDFQVIVNFLRCGVPGVQVGHTSALSYWRSFCEEIQQHLEAFSPNIYELVDHCEQHEPLTAFRVALIQPKQQS